MKRRQTALAYCRISSETQSAGDGLARQTRVIDEWASRSGTTITRTYSDVISGTRGADDRPAMRQMLDDLAASGGHPPIVVVERHDRIARDLIESELIIQRLQKLGVTIVAAETGQPIGSDDSPTGTLIRQILAAVSQFDKSSIVAKLRTSRQTMRAKTGRCEGRKPFGTRPGESETLAVMRELRASGLPFARVAAELNARGLPTRGTRNGQRGWSEATVFRILRRLNSRTRPKVRD